MPRPPLRTLVAAAILAAPAAAGAAPRVVATSPAGVQATALAAAPGGPAAVAAWVRRDAGGFVLEAAVRGPAGAWSPVQRAGTLADPGAGDHRLAVAAGAGGEAVVAWAGTRAGARRPPARFLRAVVLAGDGRPETPLTTLDVGGRAATLAGGRAVAAVDPDGAALVGWVEAGPAALAVAVRAPGAAAFAPARRVRLGRAATPAGAAGPPGGRFVVLTDEGTRAAYRRVGRAGGIGRPSRLPFHRAARGRRALALGPDGGAIAAWTRPAGRGRGRIWAAARDPAGGWTAARPLSGAPARVGAQGPVAAAGGAGVTQVGWVRPGAPGRVLLVTRSPAGWAPARPISPAGRAVSGLRLAAGPDGTAMAAWAQAGGPQGWTAGTVRAVPGPPIGLDLVAGPGPAGAPSPAGAVPALLAVGGRGVTAAVPGRGDGAAPALAVTPPRGASWATAPLAPPGGPPLLPQGLAVTGDGVPVALALTAPGALYGDGGAVVVLEDTAPENP